MAVASPVVLVRGLVVAVLLAAACSSSPESAATERVVVLAASSLREVLAVVESDLERDLKGIDLAVTSDGSSTLATAVIEGAPADVFLSADQATMTRLVEAGSVDGDAARVIATSSLIIAVAEGNPLGITGLEDLTARLVVSLCRSEVPCGAYAERAFGLAATDPPSAGREVSVAAVLAKVRLGEADAGIVYRSDLSQQPDGVDGVELAPAHNVRVEYFGVVLTGAEHPKGAQRVLDHLGRAATQATLRTYGFGAP